MFGLSHQTAACERSILGVTSRPPGSERVSTAMPEQTRPDILAEIRDTMHSIDSRELSTDELLDLAALLRCFLPQSREVFTRAQDRPLLRIVS